MIPRTTVDAAIFAAVVAFMAETPLNDSSEIPLNQWQFRGRQQLMQGRMRWHLRTTPFPTGAKRTMTRQNLWREGGW